MVIGAPEMKVLIKIDTTVDGVRYLVNPGEQLPGALQKYWTTSKAMDSMIACGAVEAPVSKSEETKPLAIMSDHPEIITKKDYNKK